MGARKTEWMPPQPSSRFLWHALAGLWVGFASTFLVAPLSPALRDAGVGGWIALLVATPLLGVLVGLASAFLPRSTPRALVCAFLLALLAGGLDDLAIRVGGRLFEGGDVAQELALLLALTPEVARATGLGVALAGVACAVPLCAAVWAARTAARQPRHTRGLARNVILVAGLTASLGVPFVTFGLSAGILWPVVSVGCGLGAIACIVQAARDLGIALWLGRLVRGDDPQLNVARASAAPPMAGIATVASMSDRPSTQHIVLRHVRHLEGPNRISQMTQPLVHLGAEPIIVRRSLVRTSVLLLLLAGAQMAMAVAATGLRLPH